MTAEEVCKICGLPKPSLCVCIQIEKTEQKIKIITEKRRYRKITTIVKGCNNGKNVSKQLKSKLACGGTFKNDVIELQGNHVDAVKEILIKLGYPNSQIEIE